jgi:hypothetical protein
MLRKQTRNKPTKEEFEIVKAYKREWMREYREKKKLEMIYKDIPIEEEPQPSKREKVFVAQRE